MQIEPYLYFEGCCDEAIEFYRRALRAELETLTRYGDPPGPPAPAPAYKGKVMHASLKIGRSSVCVSDGQCSGKRSFDGFSLSAIFDDVAATERAFNALAEGGEVVQPLAKTFFSPLFGMVADRFGVLWIIYAGDSK